MLCCVALHTRLVAGENASRGARLDVHRRSWRPWHGGARQTATGSSEKRAARDAGSPEGDTRPTGARRQPRKQRLLPPWGRRCVRPRQPHRLWDFVRSFRYVPGCLLRAASDTAPGLKKMRVGEAWLADEVRPDHCHGISSLPPARGRHDVGSGAKVNGPILRPLARTVERRSRFAKLRRISTRIYI